MSIRKTYLMVLLVVTVIAAMTVTAHAAEKTVKSIAYEPVKPYEIMKDDVWIGEYTKDKAGKEYFSYFGLELNVGDKLTVTYSDSSVVTYTLKKLDEQIEDYSTVVFRSDSGDEIARKYVRQDFSSQTTAHWKLGSDNYFDITYSGKRCSVQVTIVENPVSSIEFRPVNAYEIHEEYFIEPGLENGDELTLLFNDGSSKTYRYVENHEFFDHMKFINVDDPEDKVFSEVTMECSEEKYPDIMIPGGTYYFTLNWMGGRACEVPFTFIGHDHKTFTHVKLKKATDKREGNIEYWDCDDCPAFFTDVNKTHRILFYKTIIPKNNMTVKANTVSARAKKKTTIKAKTAFTVKNNKGKMTYKKTNGNSKITVSSAGTVTVKKGLKAGKTYKVTVKATSASTSKYASLSKTVTLKVKIK